MSKNEIKKKNISANALSNDDLEDVAGGWTGAIGSNCYYLSPQEIEKLEEAGLNVSTRYSSINQVQPPSYVTDENGNPVYLEEISKIL